MDYFEKEVKKDLDSNPLVEYLGEIPQEDKQDLLGNAKALILPIDWPEPFGLVIIEAMACGTPTIAFRNGSVPEIIEDGLNGFTVDSVEDAVDAVDDLEKVNRRTCREVFEERFTSARMAADYMRVYEELSFSKSGLRVIGKRARPAIVPSLHAPISGNQLNFGADFGVLEAGRDGPVEGSEVL